MNRLCPVCSSTTTPTTLHTHPLSLPDQFSYLPNHFNIVACQCGMVYNSSPLTQSDLNTYYQSPYYTPGRTYLDNASRNLTLARYLHSHFPESTTILDVGCGDGDLLLDLVDLGFYTSVNGVDIGEPITGDYDLIIVNHVLEHILDISPFLTNLINHLAPDGAIYIETPDATRYIDNYQTSFSYFNLEHVNHFSPSHLDWLMDNHGFSLIDMTHKSIPIAPDWNYPAVGGLWSLGSSRREPPDPDYLVASVGAYIMESEMEQEVTLDLYKGVPLIVRGFGHRAYNLLALLDNEIIAIVDQSPTIQQLTYKGQPIHTTVNPMDLLIANILPTASSIHVNEEMMRGG